MHAAIDEVATSIENRRSIQADIASRSGAEPIDAGYPRSAPDEPNALMTDAGGGSKVCQSTGQQRHHRGSQRAAPSGRADRTDMEVGRTVQSFDPSSLRRLLGIDSSCLTAASLAVLLATSGDFDTSHSSNRPADASERRNEWSFHVRLQRSTQPDRR